MDGAMEGAVAMIGQVQQGAPFPLLAQQFSSAPSAAKGGDIGYVAEGELRPEIDCVLQQMETGSVSNPIQVPGGVYVLALLDKRVSEAETLYRLRQVTVEGDEETSKSRLIELRDVLNGCDSLEDDVDALGDVSTADMGQLKASELSDPIVEALAKTDVGGLSEPFPRPDGATSIMVCEREATGTGIPTRDEIENRLIDQKLAAASKRLLRDIRRQATLVVR